jgi:hypothetical protein
MASSGRTGFRAGSGMGWESGRSGAYVVFSSGFEALFVGCLASYCGLDSGRQLG